MLLLSLAFPIRSVASVAQERRPFIIEVDNDALNVGVLGPPGNGEYTSGIRLVIPLHGRLSLGGRSFLRLPACEPGEGAKACQAWTLVIGQRIYTPPNEVPAPASLGLRPYAGWLGASVQAELRTAAVDHQLVLALGVTGEPALAEPIQRWFHGLLGEGVARGWADQLASEPTISVGYLGAPRPMVQLIGGWSALMLRPRWFAQLGTVLNRVGAGIEAAITLGQSAPARWPEIRSADPSAPLYVLGGISGALVASDLFLDGGVLHDGWGVGHEAVVYTVELGVGLVLEGRRIEWRVVRTSPLYSAEEGPHTYTTLAIAQ